jgi:hypothetical protein
MNTFKALFICTSLLIPTQATALSDDICNFLGDMAKGTMELRQVNFPMSE